MINLHKRVLTVIGTNMCPDMILAIETPANPSAAEGWQAREGRRDEK
jgi:hypothetical protein